MIEPADAWTADSAALAARLARGDERAFDEVVRLHGLDVQRLARRLLGWHADAEDVAQDVFVQVYLNRARFRGQSSLRTWLTRITVNRCRSLQRRKLLNPATLWRALRKEDAGALVVDETAGAVRSAVQRLPAREREVVVLYYLEQLSSAEVAAALDISDAAVNVRLHRARKRLEQLLAALRGMDHG